MALIYAQTLRHEFVYDNIQYVSENQPVLHGLTAKGIAWAFTTDYASNWHPLTWLSHMLDCQLYGLKPWGHHLSNVLLHAATAILLFLVLWRMTGDLWPSAFVAAVFAIHPLRVESVAWVAERKDVLSGLFFMLTLGAYVGYVHRPFSLARYLTVVVLFALGLMAKPMLVTLPCVLLLLDYWPLGRRSIPPGQLVVEKLPLLALSAASCAATALAQGTAVVQLDFIPFGSRIANALVSYVAYVGQLFYPAGLAVFYPHPRSSLPLWQTAGALLLLIGICIAVLVEKRRRPYLLVGWFWYVGMLVPVIGLVQVGQQARADRYTYLPQIGLLIALAWAAKHALASWPYRAWAWGVGAAVTVPVLMGCAWQQTSYWRDSEALWAHAVECTTNNGIAHSNLGEALCQQGKWNEAVPEFQEAIKIDPRHVEAHAGLGEALGEQGRFDDAIAEFQTAVRLRPNDPTTHNNFGMVLARQGQFDAAIAEYDQALRFNPGDVRAHNNRLAALNARARRAEALAQWEESVRRQPDNASVLGRMAWVLATNPEASVRNGPRAVELAQRAADLDGGRHAIVLDTLAAAYAEAGRFNEAVQAAQQALALASAQKNAAQADAIRARIKLYQAGSPYRELPPPATLRSGPL